MRQKGQPSNSYKMMGSAGLANVAILSDVSSNFRPVHTDILQHIMLQDAGSVRYRRLKIQIDKSSSKLKYDVLEYIPLNNAN